VASARFENLIVWQWARRLCREIYHLTSVQPFAGDFGLKDQIRRSAVSVMSNIAEGHDRNSTAEFKRFLMIARGSAAEVRILLYVASDLGYVESSRSDELVGEYIEITRC
jgi:four helix bundle protein